MCEPGLFCGFICSSSHDRAQDGATALHVASQGGHCEVVRMLLEAKADVNMKNNVSESCSSDGVCALAESIVDCVCCQCQLARMQCNYRYHYIIVRHCFGGVYGI